MSKIIIDTSIFYALLDSSDSYHQQAQTEMQYAVAQNHTLYIAYPVLVETYSLVLYRLGFDTAQRFLQYCQDCLTILNPSAEEYSKAQLKLKQYPDQKITLVDAITATLATEHQLLVWSYDFHFDIMQSQRWLLKS